MLRWFHVALHLTIEAGAARRDARIRFLKAQGETNTIHDQTSLIPRWCLQIHSARALCILAAQRPVVGQNAAWISATE